MCACLLLYFVVLWACEEKWVPRSYIVLLLASEMQLHYIIYLFIFVDFSTHPSWTKSFLRFANPMYVVHQALSFFFFLFVCVCSFNCLFSFFVRNQKKKKNR